MAGAVARCSAAKAETHTWKLRLEGTLGTLGSAAEAVTRLTAATLQAADVLNCQDPEVSLLRKGHRCSLAACAQAHLHVGSAVPLTPCKKLDAKSGKL